MLSYQICIMHVVLISAFNEVLVFGVTIYLVKLGVTKWVGELCTTTENVT